MRVNNEHIERVNAGLNFIVFSVTFLSLCNCWSRLLNKTCLLSLTHTHTDTTETHTDHTHTEVQREREEEKI